ncbi:hypothetical protein GCM10022384_07580 [Streptomyces marokkonensis]|uniref:Helix-turn-helix domain-containing protein n=1 Tax=Streptomyces marokkonensis TaxID=324855 RepID=A0ABP7NZ54_9ACTN
MHDARYTSSPTTGDRLLYDAKEVARLLSVGITTAKTLIGNGQIRSIKISRSRRVPADALREYVDRLDAEQNAR